MAKCPGTNCEMEWRWDWEMDHYREKETGKYSDSFKGIKFGIEDEDEGMTKEMELTVYICPVCKTVISIQVLDPFFGCEIFNHPAWGKLNWQAETNSYPS